MPNNKQNFRMTAPLFFITLLVGLLAGLVGSFLVILLHVVEHLAYGYSLNTIIGPKSFLMGVTAAPASRRVMALTLCGVFAGCGWWLIYRYGRPLLSIAEGVKSNPALMPRWKTWWHAVLQIITVGLGSPLGREVAPREAAVILASWLTSKANLALSDARVMAACAAGAGLAAVYNVPLGGAMFTMEVLLCRMEGTLLLAALCSSAVAVIVVRLGIGDLTQYHLETIQVNASLLIWSLLMGPVFGCLAYGFKHICGMASGAVKHNWQVPVLCFFNFMIIGLLAVYFPALLGNGRSPAQLEFSDAIGLKLTATLLLLRILIVFSSLRAGAHGGLLTPSLATGALLGVLLAGLFQLQGSMSAFALVGATAFLAAAQRMPLTAVLLLLEFTRVPLSFILPMGLAVLGAMKAQRCLIRRLPLS